MLNFVFIVAILSILFAGYFAWDVLRRARGSANMIAIADAIKEGAMAYLKRQYRSVAIFAVILFIILGFLLNWPTAIGFLAGAILSALAGFVGMSISVRANVRTAEAAKKGLKQALDVSFKGGAVTGFFIVGMSLLGVALFYSIYGDPKLVIGFGFGASLVSLFARIGGGIYTKAADVGADLVGKIEKGIPEDDPRNPAVIADNVGDNVGDCAGMGADLFETYAVTMIAAMLLGILVFADSTVGIIYPLVLGAMAIIASAVGTFFVKLGRSNNIMNALYRGLIAASIISVILFAITTALFGMSWSYFFAGLVGLAVTVAINFITDYYTSKKFRPVKEIASASETGAGTNLISGLAVGMEATFWPTLVIAAAILLAYFIPGGGLAGIYGVAIAAVAMLSTTGIIVAIDSYGPITDNAGGIAEMTGQPKNVRKVTDALDAVGNTTKAVTKGYAIGSAALGALVLFGAFVQEVGAANKLLGLTTNVSEWLIDNPFIIIGLFIGAMLPFIFSSFAMRSVGKAAHSIVKEVRRQFKQIPGIMERKAKPDYAKCVDIVTKAAQREMIKPVLIAVLAPLIVGILLGVNALAGLLVGVIISGLMMALFLTTSGAAWDNAKKYIEEGFLGGKGSDAHKAAVVGDTVGDPTKDTAGPAINSLIKVINTFALLLVALLIQYHSALLKMFGL